jgi:hypothetical protein
MERKKFLISVGAGLTGFALFKSIPLLNIFASKKTAKIEVKPNPLAVSRKKIGDRNV